MIDLGEVGRDLAKFEEKNEVFAEMTEGDSPGELTMRSLAGETRSTGAYLFCDDDPRPQESAWLVICVLRVDDAVEEVREVA